MTISGPAVPVFCMYLVAAERQGVDPGVLNGTLQTDIFKEYIAQKEWLFQPEPHLRLIGDLMEHCAASIPAYKPLSVSGYHIREAGATAAQELAYTLADGFGYVELGLSRGLDVDTFAPGLSFFFDAHLDFFEEIAKFRAARRIWARWMKETYGARTDKAQWLRFHTQTAGVSSPRSSRTTTSSAPPWRRSPPSSAARTRCTPTPSTRPSRSPSEQAAEIALRTQQVLMEETGVANVADPLGGSWYVEQLTDRIEADAEKIFDRIRERGTRAHPDGQHPIGPMTSGILRGIEDGWFTGEIAESAFQYQRALEKGDKRVVGVNVHHGSVTGDLEILRVSHEVERDQVSQLADRKAARDDAKVTAALDAMLAAARDGSNMIAPMLDAVHGPSHARRDLRGAARRVGRLHGAAGLLRPCGRARERPAADPSPQPGRRRQHSASGVPRGRSPWRSDARRVLVGPALRLVVALRVVPALAGAPGGCRPGRPAGAPRPRARPGPGRTAPPTLRLPRTL